ncbi:MAG: Sec-independent protein translocase protein TatB [Pseudomonadota bacterium]
MFDLGWTELMVIGIVALIVVGPKDLPGMFRAVGKFVGKAKQMAREFSRAMNDAADDAGVNDMTKTIRAATNPVGTAMDQVKKSTESFTSNTLAGHPPKRAEFDEERQEMAKKIHEKSAADAEKRVAAEKAAAEKAAKKPAAKKTTTKKPAAKKPAAKAAPAKKPAAKKTCGKNRIFEVGSDQINR